MHCVLPPFSAVAAQRRPRRSRSAKRGRKPSRFFAVLPKGALHCVHSAHTFKRILSIVLSRSTYLRCV